MVCPVLRPMIPDFILGLNDVEQDIWYIIRDIRDPEYPHTLSQLRVIIPSSR
jgi:hypothetical protein